MDKFQFLVSVFLILLKCEELTMQHLTFSNTTKSWKDAVKHCSGKDGVLESNVTLLKEQHEFKNANEGDEVWIGKFRTLTNWTYIRGCFLINGNLQHFELELFNTAELRIQCQVLCNNYKFYSTKKADCYCIANISSFVRSKNCNCVGCYKVWEHQLPSFYSADPKHKCIATISCDGEKFNRGSKICDDEHGRYKVVCDNDADLGYTYSNYKAATEECENRGSFIKWHSMCNAINLPQYWTSGTRDDETFVIRKAYFTENLQPEECYVWKKGKGQDDKNCQHDKKRFFCRFGTDEDKGDIISIPNLRILSNKNAKSNDSGNMIVGIVVPIVVIILITVVIIIIVFMFRRIHSRKLLSLSTVVKDEPSTSRMDSNTVSAAYEQLNKTDKNNITHCQSYDQLIVHVADKTIKRNTRISREKESKYESIEEPIEKYNNALTAEYEQLEQNEIAKTTNVYDPLHYTPVEDADPTNARSNNIALREEHRKYETSQTENETDTNVVTHTAGNESTNDRSKLIVSGEERTHNESSKDKKEFDSRIVFSEYEQLDITEQDKRTKTYDQLHFKHSVVTEHDEPTD